MNWPFKKKPKDNLGVFNVPWKRYSHAYGPATDVPNQILDLQSKSAEVREHALWSLFGNIYHQGTVYEASQYAVPFLARLVAIPKIESRHEIINLIAHLAGGSSYHDVHREFLTERCSQEELDRLVTEEMEHVQACRDAVVKELAAYGGLFEDPDPEIRAALGYLLAILGKDAVGLINQIHAHALDDPHPEVRASMTLALPSIVEQNRNRFSAIDINPDDAEPVHALAFCLSTFEGNGIESSIRHLDRLLEFLVDPPELLLDASKLCWFDGGVESIITSRLDVLDRELLLPYLGSLLDLMTSDRRFYPEPLVRLVLSTAFGESRFEGDVTLLSSAQKKVIIALFDSNRIIMRDIDPNLTFGNTSMIAIEYGLPSSAEELEELADKCRES